MWMSLSSSHIDRYPTLRILSSLGRWLFVVHEPQRYHLDQQLKRCTASFPHDCLTTDVPTKPALCAFFMSKMWARKNKRITVYWDIHRWLTGTNVWTMLYISKDVSWWTLLLWSDWISLARTFWRLRVELWGMKYKSEVICWVFLFKN